MKDPVIIQGGMGMGVSHWRLANAVARRGQLGVISGTALDTIFVRRLQNGDPGGHLRRALDTFPDHELVAQVLKDYWIPDGKAPQTPYKSLEMFSLQPSHRALELCILANFAEVVLAKEGHSGVVGINLLEKILLPNLPSLYGAMLGGVDYVLMGAGIPREIPAALDQMSQHQAAKLKVHVDGVRDAVEEFTFDPGDFWCRNRPALKRPKFLAIIGSTTLGMALAKKTRGIDGFVVEGPLAGGHNAPPRGQVSLDERGAPVYGPRDKVDLEVIASLGLPFYLAGAYADPDRLQQAFACGARGVQIGTAFAFCEESGVDPAIRRQVLEQVANGDVDVFTDPRASPTSFPFKVVQLEGSMSDAEVYGKRPRLCNLGYLRVPYMTPGGTIGYRCPAENPQVFAAKGGHLHETEGRKCLCNGLLSVIGLAQSYPNGYVEPPLLTSGEDVKRLRRFLKPGKTSYSASDVIDFVLGRQGCPTGPSVQGVS